MKKNILAAMIALFIAIISFNTASAQVVVTRTVHAGHHHAHHKHWDKHDKGKHKGWSNPHNPHSAYRRKY